MKCVKIAVVAALIGLAAVDARQVDSEMSEESSAATPLRGGCVAGTQCDQVKIVGAGSGTETNIDDALEPIGDWIKEFKKREGVSGDLYAAAEVTAQPLLMRLKRQQQTAVEALQRSNANILEHVKRETIQHMVKLLSKEQVEEVKAEQSEEKKLAAAQAADDVKLAKENAAIESSLAAH